MIMLHRWLFIKLIVGKMKKDTFIFLGLLFVSSLYSQVGVNTQNPRGIFQIDPKQNTTGIGAGDADDVIVTTDGKMGIGTVDPQARLDLRGTFSMRDGNEMDGYVLTAVDNVGRAKWQVRPPLTTLYGKLNEAISIGVADVNVTTSDLVLSKGRWIIIAKLVGTALAGDGKVTDTGYLNQYLGFIKLRSSADGYVSDIATSGSLPEQKRTLNAINFFTVQLAEIVDVPADNTRYRIYSSSQCNCLKSTSNMTGARFVATKLK